MSMKLDDLYITLKHPWDDEISQADFEEKLSEAADILCLLDDFICSEDKETAWQALYEACL